MGATRSILLNQSTRKVNTMATTTNATTNAPKTRAKRELSPEAQKLNRLFGLAMLLGGHSTREALAKASDISPLTISAAIKRGKIYRGMADAIKPLLAISDEDIGLLKTAIETKSAYPIISDWVTEAPTGSGFNRTLFEAVTTLKASINAVARLNKFAGISDFFEKTEISPAFLELGYIPVDIWEEIQAVRIGKAEKPLQYLQAIEELVKESPDGDNDDEEDEDL
jgi:hypothetical protein